MFSTIFNLDTQKEHTSLDANRDIRVLAHGVYR